MADPALPRCPLWAKIVATGFGVGYIPFAPGTFGSLAALLVLFGLKWIVISQAEFIVRHVLVLASLNHFLAYIHLILVLFYCVLGIPAAALFARTAGLHDPKQVVIDEFAGQTLAFMPLVLFDSYYFTTDFGYSSFLCLSPIGWLLAFALFRSFDIWKPWPIRQLEHLPGGWGIMLDDLAAGLIAGLILLLFVMYFPRYLYTCF